MCPAFPASDTYGDLDNLLARAGEIKQPKRREALMANADLARVSRDLVRLRDDVPLPATLDSFARREPDAAQLLPFLKENQFRTILARVEPRLAKGSVGEVRPVDARPAKPSAAESAASQAVAGDRSGYVLVQDLAALDGWITQARAAGFVAFDPRVLLPSIRRPHRWTPCWLS